MTLKFIGITGEGDTIKVKMRRANTLRLPLGSAPDSFQEGHGKGKSLFLDHPNDGYTTFAKAGPGSTNFDRAAADHISMSFGTDDTVRMTRKLFERGVAENVVNSGVLVVHLGVQVVHTA